jgi:CubicO group peptidase (beta-lactamase class C family)
VLGIVVARASGMPFEDFLRTRVFEPLQMRDTGFHVPADKLERLAVNYGRDAESGELKVVDHPRDSSFAKPKAFHSGGGGLVSTIDDYQRFATMLLQGGELDGVRILSRKSVERMSENALRPDEMVEAPFGRRFISNAYGLGVGVIDNPARTGSLATQGRFGWGGAAGTWFWVDPQEELVAIMMIQRMSIGDPIQISADFDTAIYQALR